MTDSYVQVAPDSTGKKLDTENLTVGSDSVHRQRTEITGASALEIARVKSTSPLVDDYGLVVRALGPSDVFKNMLDEQRQQTRLLRVMLLALTTSSGVNLSETDIPLDDLTK